MYPLSEKRRFPDINKITQWLEKTGISEVKLGIDDVQSLLTVLEFDGRVEKIPGGGALLKMDSDEDDEEVQFKRKRKRRDASDDDDEEDGAKKRIRAAASDSDDDLPPKKAVKNSKKEGKKPATKSKKNDSDDDDEDEEDGRGVTNSYIRNDADFSDVSYVYRAIRPPNEDPSIFSGSLFGGSWLAGPAHTQDAPSLGALPWAEAPCVHCPQLDFCLEGGPVNASSCEYYESWLDPERKLLVTKFEKLHVEEAAVGIEMEAS